MTDPIADMLTRIRNAIAVNKTTVEMPHSKAKESVAQVLREHGYIEAYVVESGTKPTLQLTLNQPHTHSPITQMQRISKPGRRVYVSKTDIPIVLRGHGMAIVSTSQGVMSGKEARRHGLGGELMSKVW